MWSIAASRRCCSACSRLSRSCWPRPVCTACSRYAVTQRSREIGLRIALGTSAGAVVRMIIGRGLTLTGLGLAAGLALAAGATRALSTLLYHVGAGDPGTFGLVA